MMVDKSSAMAGNKKSKVLFAIRRKKKVMKTQTSF